MNDALPPPGKLRLRIWGFHIPSFKNSKMMTRGKLITKPANQKIMQAIIPVLESQLRFWSQTKDAEISTVLLARSLIACATQFDDSHQWLPEMSIKVQQCEKGQEGANLDIEEI